jgi:hypothetical protein
VSGHLVDAAWAEARRLGHHWVGAEHLLLALVRPGESSPAARALRSSGETHDRLEAQVVDCIARCKPRVRLRPDATPCLNPRAYQILGRAEGFAAGLGSPDASPEHVLLAILWDTASPLGAPEGRRAVVLERLRELGGPVPATPLPPDDLTVWGDDVPVPFDRLLEVVRGLPSALPAGARYGFNHDGEGEAWVVAEASVDLEPVVAQILADTA